MLTLQRENYLCGETPSFSDILDRLAVVVVVSFLLSSIPILGYLSLGDYCHWQLLVEGNPMLAVNDPQWAKTHHNMGITQVGRIDDVANGVAVEKHDVAAALVAAAVLGVGSGSANWPSLSPKRTLPAHRRNYDPFRGF
jgi:hypothetical protein